MTRAIEPNADPLTARNCRETVYGQGLFPPGRGPIISNQYGAISIANIPGDGPTLRNILGWINEDNSCIDWSGNSE